MVAAFVSSAGCLNPWSRTKQSMARGPRETVGSRASLARKGFSPQICHHIPPLGSFCCRLTNPTACLLPGIRDRPRTVGRGSAIPVTQRLSASGNRHDHGSFPGSYRFFSFRSLPWARVRQVCQVSVRATRSHTAAAPPLAPHPHDAARACSPSRVPWTSPRWLFRKQRSPGCGNKYDRRPTAPPATNNV